MSFARPWLLLLLLALPLWYWRRRRQDVPAARFSDVTLPATVSANRWWVVLPPALRAAALAALVLAAAGPQIGGDTVEVKQEGHRDRHHDRYLQQHAGRGLRAFQPARGGQAAGGGLHPGPERPTGSGWWRSPARR